MATLAPSLANFSAMTAPRPLGNGLVLYFRNKFGEEMNGDICLIEGQSLGRLLRTDCLKCVCLQSTERSAYREPPVIRTLRLRREYGMIARRIVNLMGKRWSAVRG